MKDQTLCGIQMHARKEAKHNSICKYYKDNKLNKDKQKRLSYSFFMQKFANKQAIDLFFMEAKNEIK